METCEENNSKVAAFLPLKTITQPWDKIGYFNQNSMKAILLCWGTKFGFQGKKCTHCENCVWVENSCGIHSLIHLKGVNIEALAGDLAGEGESIILTVTAAVAGAAHGISIAALLPPAAVKAPRGSVVRAVAVASHAALLITAAWIHLTKTTYLT